MYDVPIYTNDRAYHDLAGCVLWSLISICITYVYVHRKKERHEMRDVNYLPMRLTGFVRFLLFLPLYFVCCDCRRSIHVFTFSQRNLQRGFQCKVAFTLFDTDVHLSLPRVVVSTVISAAFRIHKYVKSIVALFKRITCCVCFIDIREKCGNRTEYHFTFKWV